MLPWLRPLLLLATAHLATAADEAIEKRMGPVFLAEPPSRVEFLNTTGVGIDCLAYGQPGARVSWRTSDGSPAEPVPGLRHVLPNGTLVLWPFPPDRYRQDVHGAVYRCLAANAVGAVLSRDVHVRGIVRQYYDVQVYDEYVIRGNTAVLMCHIPSFVRDFVTVTSWVRDDVLAITSTAHEGGKYSVFPSGELHIRNVTPSDGSMSYRCQTTHRLTQEPVISVSAGRLIVTDSSGTVPPRVTDGRSFVRTLQGDTVEIPCAAQGFPVPKYSWFRYSGNSTSGPLTPVYLDPRMVQLSGSLLIRQVALEDAGKLVCAITNSAGEERVEVQLVVTAPLSAHVQPQQQIVDVGNPARFNCSFSGHPVAHVDWLKDGRPLYADGMRVRFTGRTLLSISTVRREDGGMYQCVVSNDGESAQGSAQLLLGDAAPILHSTFQEETVHPGPFVSLRCIASGSPLPQVTWTLDGSPLPPDDPRLRVGDYITPQGRVVSYVNVTSVRTLDGGEYTCEARSPAGSTRHSARLNVYGSPAVRPMPDVSAVSGEALVLRCHVSGHPIEAISWSRDGNRLPITRRQEVLPNGTLTIRDVQRGVDNGVYKCRVWSPQGQTASGTVRVHVMVKPVIDPFSFPRHLQEGMRSRLGCTVIQGDPPFSIRWRKDGRAIDPALGILVRDDDFSSDLTFSSVEPRHNGNYTCIASNGAAAVSHTALLVVDVPPRWRVEPRDTSVIAGQNVRIDCLADGFPTPVVTWERGSGLSPRHYVAIASGPHYEVYANGSLLVKHVQEADGGYYLCQASNGIASGLSKVVFLTVHVPPRLETKFRSESVRKGETVRLGCRAEGDHPMTVSWTLDKQPLNPAEDPRYDVKEEVDKKAMSSDITILAAERKDSALFTCLVTNAYGHADMNIRLIVQEPPEPPREVRVTEVKSRTAKISWPPPYTGNSPISRYLLECRFQSVDGLTHNATIGGEASHYQLRGLGPAKAYVCRVRAENQVGLGDFSDPVTFTTAEEVPGGPPLDIRAEAVDSTTIQVTWRPPAKELWNGAIKGYYVGYKVVESADSYLYKTLEVGRGAIQETVALSMLRRYTRYSVLVQAYNAMGAGPRSDEVIVRTLEDVPSEPPQHVQCVPLTSQSLQIAWEAPPPASIHGVLQGYRVSFRHEGNEEQGRNTTDHELQLSGLLKHANYSVTVAAFNHKGLGQSSSAVHCHTMEDVPGPPSDLKAVSLSPDTVLVRWKTPQDPNGVLTKYALHWRRLSEPATKNATVIRVQPTHLQHKIQDLTENSRHEFWVSASTSRGEGRSTRVVSHTVTQRVPGRVLDFGGPVSAVPGDKVTLGCQMAGLPVPERKWKLREDPLPKHHRLEVTRDGSLIIRKLRVEDSGNFTCSVQNKHGSDEVTYSLVVREPPASETPSLQLKVSTSDPTTVILELPKSTDDPVRGYDIHFKAEGREWQRTHLLPESDGTARLDGLECGTRYQLYAVSDSSESRLGPVTFKTQGTAPVAAKQEEVVSSNTTHLLLHLGAWQSGGCPLTGLTVEYRPHSHAHWSVLRADPSRPLLAVADVVPDTWYVVRVTARNVVGTTTAEYDVITMTPAGGDLGSHLSAQSSFFEDTTTLVSMASSGVVLVAGIVAVVCLILYKRRRSSRPHYRGASSSAMLAESSSSRSDVATTTALLAHLEKKAGPVGGANRRDIPSYFSSPVRKVAPAGAAPRPAHPASSHSSSARQTRSEHTEYESDEIAPYATFQLPGPSTEDDLCNLEEFKTFSVRHGEPPYLIRSSLDPPSCRSGKASEEFYHAPNSHSLTSGSSNQEELLRAYEYARRYGDPHWLEHKTSESEATDPGIRQFSGTPPRPNERRQGACLTSAESSGKPQHDSSTSGDTTPVNLPRGFSVALPQSSRSRAKGKGIKKGV